jgi:hypothetical protein
LAAVYKAWQLVELRRIAEANIGDFLRVDRHGRIIADKDGRPKLDLNAIERAKLKGIKELVIDKDRVRLVQDDRLEAQRMIGEATGLMRQAPPSLKKRKPSPISRGAGEDTRVGRERR